MLQMSDKSARGIGIMEQNSRRFNEILNKSGHPRAIYSALLALVKPGVQQADDVLEKRQIIVGEVLTLLDEPQSNQQAV